MKKLPMALGAFAASVALLTTGCSDPGNGGSTATTVAVTAWPAQDTTLAGTTLTLWTAQTSSKLPAAVISAFEAKTGAKVNLVTIPDPYENGIQTKVATGDKPDLALWQPTASQLSVLNAKQNLQPLDNAPWIDSLKPQYRDLTGILDKTRYAALISTPSVIGVYYNKQVLKDSGITTLPKNFSELLADADKVKAAGKTPFFDIGGDKWGTQWFVDVQLGEAAKAGLWDRVNQRQEKFTDPTILGAIQTYQDLIKKGMFNSNIKTATFDEQTTAMLDGSTGMTVQLDSLYTAMLQQVGKDKLDSTVGFFPISQDGTIATYNPDQSNGLVAFNTGDQKRMAAAKQFMAFWMGEGYSAFVNDYKTISIETAVQDPAGLPELATTTSSALSDAVGTFQAQAVANPDLYLNLADMIQGSTTPQQVAEKTQSQFDQLAAAAGVAGF